MVQRWIIPAAVLGGVALGVTGIAFVNNGGGSRPAVAQATPVSTPLTKTISVDASGSVKGKPDTANVNLGVQADKASAEEALNEASAKARSLIDLLKAQGIAEDDITTTDLSLWPRTDNEGKQVLGYVASNSVNATIRDLTKAGSVIDAATKAVGDSIRLGGVSFSIADTTPFAAQAREQAVLQAKAQGAQLAKAAGVGLGPIAQVSTVSYDLPQPQVYAASAAGARDSATPAPVQPGTQEITARVTVVFELTS
jgi:uncharacterized protein YggE